MFLTSVNPVCNNFLFTTHTLEGMHPSAERLLFFARNVKKFSPELEDSKVLSAIGRQLNASPQTVTNWKKRGISLEGALDMQRVLGLNAVWLLDGEGEPDIAHGFTQRARQVAEIFESLTDPAIAQKAYAVMTAFDERGQDGGAEDRPEPPQSDRPPSVAPRLGQRHRQ